MKQLRLYFLSLCAPQHLQLTLNITYFNLQAISLRGKLQTTRDLTYLCINITFPATASLSVNQIWVWISARPPESSEAPCSSVVVS